jgi:hypothetical protein
MRKLVVMAALAAAVVVALGTASSASADVVTFTGSCTTGTTTFNAEFVNHPASAFNPLFVTNTDTGTAMGVLIPHTIVLNGVEIVSQSPGIDTSALSGVLTTCTFTTRGGTRLFVVTGILAPTIP